MNNERINWSLLPCFLAVARLKTLTAAAKSLDLSQPTLSRRIDELELTMALKLFDRYPTGFTLTDFGRQLFSVAEEMEHTAANLLRLQESILKPEAGLVRVAVGEWFGRFLSLNADIFRIELPNIQLEIVLSQTVTSLARREADIAIRNIRPDVGNLVVQRVASVAYTAYASKKYAARVPQAFDDRRWADCDWIGFDAANSHNSTANWLRQRIKNYSPMFQISSSREMVHATASGAGLAVLPCFVGDHSNDLCRVLNPPDDLVMHYWMVMHQDSADTPRIRSVAKAIQSIASRNENSLLGRLLN